jgi:hypothetical protein
VHVLEGLRPADALLLYMKGTGGTSVFKLAQVFKHPNLRPRLFHRLCAAAAAARVSLDCAVAAPRLRAVNVRKSVHAGVSALPPAARARHSFS